MNRHIKVLFAAVFFIAMLGAGEILYIFAKEKGLKIKEKSVATISLPDLALSTEAHFIRHRSLADLFEIFGIDPELHPYFPSDFVYSAPPYLNAKEEIRVEP
ncbi:hypothetical protein [Nitrosophilus alvini]|uniref:hypothetical protein n=1 Tax=Nitrosophilus alvini TaxID=2714855 RepID=UPI00190C4C35|nr:hypothetical protein [Nitrosophilus alvini]